MPQFTQQAQRRRGSAATRCSAAPQGQRSPPPTAADKVQRLRKEYFRTRGEAGVQLLGADIWDECRRLAVPVPQSLVIAGSGAAAGVVFAALAMRQNLHTNFFPPQEVCSSIAGAAALLGVVNYLGLKRVQPRAALPLPKSNLRRSAEHLHRRAEHMQRRMADLRAQADAASSRARS